MRNRAKCALCGDIIESFHHLDYVTCSCDHISIDGGPDNFKAAAYDWNNFLRIDDNNNEFTVTVLERNESKPEQSTDTHTPTKQELLDMLDEMRKNIENLPDHAMTAPITHYDFASLLLLVSSIFRAEDIHGS